MKLIAIGDIHGRDNWKQIINSHPDADRIIFMGDYWDSFDIPFMKQAENFCDIVEFKKQNYEKVCLLIGNHDFQYYPAFMDAHEEYAGFQKQYSFLIKELMENNKSDLAMAYLNNNWLFTHAGVTSTWVKESAKILPCEEFEDITEWINVLWKYKPSLFYFNGTDQYGDDPTQSPIWVRPQSLMKNAYKYETIKQVVGHTQRKQITVHSDRYFFIDVPEQYLVIEDGNYKIESI